jgi:CRP-like cAMP-binding protein
VPVSRAGIVDAVSASTDVIVRNRILCKLPRAEFRRLRPRLEQVVLHQNQVLYRPGDVVSHVYFPHDAVVSLLFDVDKRRTVEVAMEGNEGAVGLAIYLGGVTSGNLSVVRNAGTAMRLNVDALTECANQCGELQDLLHRYLHALVTQIAQSGVCNRFHSIDARLARWLLMTRDRTSTGELHATQEFIAHMLGVRRSSVTAAACEFHQQKIIDYRRGRIEILDHVQLRAACCDCYGLMKRQYDSFLN